MDGPNNRITVSRLGLLRAQVLPAAGDDEVVPALGLAARVRTERDEADGPPPDHVTACRVRGRTWRCSVSRGGASPRNRGPTRPRHGARIRRPGTWGHESAGTDPLSRGQGSGDVVLLIAGPRSHCVGRDDRGDPRRSRRPPGGHAADGRRGAGRPGRAGSGRPVLGPGHPAVRDPFPRVLGARRLPRPGRPGVLERAGPGRGVRAHQPAARRRAGAPGEHVPVPADEQAVHQPALSEDRGHPGVFRPRRP